MSKNNITFGIKGDNTTDLEITFFVNNLVDLVSVIELFDIIFVVNHCKVVHTQTTLNLFNLNNFLNKKTNSLNQYKISDQKKVHCYHIFLHARHPSN